MEFNELVLSTSREIIFMTEINRESATDLIQRISIVNNIDDEMERATDHLKESYKREEHPIVIRLSSGGGEILHGYNIVTAIKTSRTPIVIIASGIIASMALYMLASAHHRVADESTEFMYHQPSGGHIGTLSETQVSIERIKRMEERYNTFLVKRSGGKLNKDYLRELSGKNLDHWFSAQEALDKWGIIDAVITDDEFYNEELDNETKDELIQGHAEELVDLLESLSTLTGNKYKIIIDEDKVTKEKEGETKNEKSNEKTEKENKNKLLG